jgi:hypothetical protein
MGIGIVAIGLSLVTAFSIYLTWHANRLGVIDVVVNALPCVLLLVAGVLLRGLQPIGRILFSVAITLTLGGAMMVINARPDIQLRMLFFAAPQLLMAGYLFTPRVRVVFSRQHREGVIRRTQEVMLNTPGWAWTYLLFMVGFILASANQRIHH